jgi:uncharacterized protein with von Willebrand factor type A (vWA) domain
MLSRIFWIGLAGLALIGGMILQGGGSIFSWGDHREISAKVEGSIEDRVDRAIDRSFDKMQVQGSDGREVDVPAETKRAMAGAVAELVKAEADLAVAKVSEGSEEELNAARARREKARAEVDRLEEQLRRIDRASPGDREALREQIKREVQEDIRATVRESVGS